MVINLILFLSGVKVIYRLVVY